MLKLIPLLLSITHSVPLIPRLKAFATDVNVWWRLKSKTDRERIDIEACLNSEMAELTNIYPVVLAMADLKSEQLSKFDEITSPSGANQLIESTEKTAETLADFAEKYFETKERLRRVTTSPFVPFINFEPKPRLASESTGCEWLDENYPRYRGGSLIHFSRIENEELWQNTQECAARLMTNLVDAKDRCRSVEDALGEKSPETGSAKLSAKFGKLPVMY